jgi:Family of unknown function (DUF6349)
VTRRRAPGPGQIDLAAEVQLDRTPVCLYRSDARGLAARIAEFEKWKAEYGSWGSLLRSHAWTVTYTSSSEPSERCQPTLLAAHLSVRIGTDSSAWPDCDCCASSGEGLYYRGACRNPDCNWEGVPVGDENPGAEEAHDHAWPGWRDVPVVTKWPGRGSSRKDKEADARWQAQVVPQYPPGWLEAGGPIRTYRKPPGTRHNGMYATPWGGYDMGVIA